MLLDLGKVDAVDSTFNSTWQVSVMLDSTAAKLVLPADDGANCPCGSELLRLKPDILVAATSSAAQAVQHRPWQRKRW